MINLLVKLFIVWPLKLVLAPLKLIGPALQLMLAPLKLLGPVLQWAFLPLRVITWPVRKLT
ncbi:MAG: hypothetical protein H6742_13570 [Alphaproteobacteria bacterium]|nr:hypothetical protein [Alphaproteobacteria bacterium]